MVVVELLLSWLLTYALHSTLLLGGAWLVQRAVRGSCSPWLETMWRCALILPIASSLLVQLPRAPSSSAIPVVSIQSSAVWAPAGPDASGAVQTRVQPSPASTSMSNTPEPKAASSWRFELTATTQRGLLLLWLLGVAFGLAGLGLAVLRMRRRRRDWQACSDPDWLASGARIANVLPAPAPRLYTGAGSSPLALMDNSVLIPDWALPLPSARRYALLAHELAHLARRDPWWRLVARVIERLFWFQPLNRLARQRLEAHAEFMCDALAVGVDTDPRALAGCLAACAIRGSETHPLAAAIASHPSLLRRRISQLTEGIPMQSTSSPLLRGAIALACAGVLYALPGVELYAGDGQSARASKAGTSSSSSSSSSDHNRNVSISHSDSGGEISMSYKSSDDDGTLEVGAEGKVGFSAAEDAVVSLSADGRFEIEDDRDGTEREIIYKAADGGVSARYYVDGDESPLDADGRAWLARILPQVLRDSGFDVEGRIERIHRRGGNAAVLDEIELIAGAHARRSYLAGLFARGPLNSAEIDRTLVLAFAIASDFELRTALQSLIESQDLSPHHRDRIVERMATMSSDFEARQVLVAMVPKLTDSGAPVLLKALAAIESDFERRQVLDVLFARRDLTPRLLAIGLEGVSGIESDFERRSVLTAAAPHVANQPAAMLKFVAATREFDSDFERRTTLVALLEVGKPDRAVVAAVLESIAQMDGDFEARQVLTAIAPLVGNDQALRARYRDISADLSDFERLQAEDALVDM